MLNSPLISDLIFKGEVHEIKEIMAKSRELGMQTFDQALFDLYEAGTISYEDALRNADSVNELRLKIKLNSKVGRRRATCRPAPSTSGWLVIRANPFNGALRAPFSFLPGTIAKLETWYTPGRGAE